MPFPKRKRQNDSGEPKRSKLNNSKITVNGETFDSEGEFIRWEELCKMREAALIHMLERQPAFELQKHFRHPSFPKMILAITYKADFRYITDAGQVIVEDVKGFKTKDFAIKMKLFLHKFPYIDFQMPKPKRLSKARRAALREEPL